MNTLNEKQYNALKSTTMNFKEMAKRYLSTKEIELLKFQEINYLEAQEGGSLANFSSFAYYYHKDKNEELRTVKETSLKNIEILKSWDELQERNARLHSNFVILGVNAGAKANGHAFDQFENFQRRDFGPAYLKFRNALLDSKYHDLYLEHIEGAYMTDFVKGLPTSDGGALRTHVNKAARQLGYTKEQRYDLHDRFAKLFKDILEQELKLITNEKPTILVLTQPNAENNYLMEMIERSGFDKDHTIIPIYHYSAAVSRENSVKAFETVFKSKGLI